MGRVEEALRRARAAEAAAMPRDGEVATLADDPFPEEPGAPAAVAAPEPVPTTLDLETPAGPSQDDLPDPSREKPSGLFDHIEGSVVGKLVVDRTIVPVSREQYRRLAATLLHGQAATGLKVIMVTSAAVGEGKTLTASNLALTFSESYRRRTLLIDADLRRPSVHQVFGFEAPTGLSEALLSHADEKLPLHRLSPYLTTLPAGHPSQDPMAGLSSDRMRRIVREARDAFEWVIIDTPPVGLLSDASLVSAIADGVVLVVRAGVTPYDLVQRAVQLVGRERVLGVVLNSVSVEQSPSYYSYRHYYGSSGTTAAAGR
jgi:capsular exopolysaccharide synthesis family protein